MSPADNVVLYVVAQCCYAEQNSFVTKLASNNRYDRLIVIVSIDHFAIVPFIPRTTLINDIYVTLNCLKAHVLAIIQSIIFVIYVFVQMLT